MSWNAGEIIERAIRRSGVSIAELARRINVDRRTIYYWFKQPSLQVETISKIGDAIEHNFSADFPQYSGQLSQIEGQKKSTSKNRDNAVIYYWKNKYIELLERYTILLQQNSVTANSF